MTYRSYPQSMSPFCPVHFPLRGECGSWCAAARDEFDKAAWALADYWDTWSPDRRPEHPSGQAAA